VRADLRRLGDLPVRWVVNTLAHYDHTFGNTRFGPASDLGAPIYAHELVPAHLDAYERPMLAEWIATGREPKDELSEVVITAPTVLVGDTTTLDLGDRVVQLLHLGRGHTDNDLVVHVPDAGAWLVGDLLEESGPPMYGSGSFPLDWPATIDRLRAAVTEQPGAGARVLVPGHGAVVDERFAAAQQWHLQAVADIVRDLFAAGIPVDAAVREGGDRWPFPAAGMLGAVRDGYRQLLSMGAS